MSLLQYIVSGGLHEIIPVISEQFLVNKPLLSKSILLALNVIFANRLGKKNEDSLIRRDSYLQRWSSGQS